MTREEAIKIAGLEYVEQAEREACECTCRVTDGTEWNGYTEFSASSDYNENMDRVVVFYYQPNELVTVGEDEEAPDLGSLNWEIDHYEVI